jgi:hypothetical protein
MTSKKEVGKASKSGATKKAKATATEGTAAANPRVFSGALSAIGWSGERDFPLVCLDKQTREAIGVQPQSIVKVRKVGVPNKVVMAMVVHQFKPFVGQHKATVSTKLGQELELDLATDKIDVTGEGVLESEADTIRKAMVDNIRANARTNLSPVSDEPDESLDDNDSRDGA